MISESELVARVELLDSRTLQRWIDLGWVLPDESNLSVRFDEADVARVRLICELHYELLIEDDSLPVVLSLMDQLYAARRALGTLASAVAAQPIDVQQRIATIVSQSHTTYV